MDAHSKVFPFLQNIHSIIDNKNLQDKERKEELDLIREKLQELLETSNFEADSTTPADDRPRRSVLDTAAAIQFPARSRANDLRPVK